MRDIDETHKSIPETFYADVEVLIRKHRAFKKVFFVFVGMTALALAGLSYFVFEKLGQIEREAKRMKPSIETQRLVLKGADAKTRLSLEMKDNSKPQVTFFNDEGNTVLALGLTDDGHSFMHMMDATGNSRVHINVSNDVARMAIVDKNKNDRLIFGLSADDTASIEILNTPHTASVMLKIPAMGDPTLSLSKDNKPFTADYFNALLAPLRPLEVVGPKPQKE